MRDDGLPIDGGELLPPHESWRLLTAATGLSKARLMAGGAVTPAAAARFRELARRRHAGEPLQYLEGSVTFGPVELAIDGRALVPRPETEQLWELAVAAARDLPPRVIVDLCTGSGNLALALKHAFPDADVYATEIDGDTIALARENAAATGLDVTILQGDLFDPLPVSLTGSVSLLVANPPYLAQHEVEALPPDVRDHEPRGALVAGSRGDEVLGRIAAAARDWLASPGVIAIEISEFQGARALELFAAYDAEVLRDLTSRDRFVIGRR